MFGLQILDIAIGLIFIYLLLALVCTAASELFAGFRGRRAKNLWVGIGNLLADSQVKFNDPKIPNSPKELVELFYAHPLIKALYEQENQPSYIPSRTFALTLLDIVVPAQPNAVRNIADVRALLESLPASSDIRRTLLALLDEAGGDLDKLQANIEIWFNNAMDRVSGWYKQRTQWVIMALAIIVSALANADTLQIAKTLANDAAVREAIVAQAQEFVKNPPPPPTATPAATGIMLSANTVANTGLRSSLQPPIAGAATSSAEPAAKSPAEEIKGYVAQLQGLGLKFGWQHESPRAWTGGDWFSKIVGLLLTALAVSLGAPFWFDTLNKVITIRAAGKSPKDLPKSPEAPAKRPEEIPPK